MSGALAAKTATVHFALALGWIAYVVYLPGLFEQAGMARTWLVWMLLADQALFALVDAMAGSLGDRLRHHWSRLGAWMLRAAAVSSLAMMALPWAAGTGQPALLVACTALWIATSAALRAPVFALLNSNAPPADSKRLAGMMLAGSAAASVLSPWLAGMLRTADPRAGLALGAALLGAAAWWLCRTVRPAADAHADTHADADAGSLRGRVGSSGWPAVLVVGLAALAFAFGVQVHVSLIGDARFRALDAPEPQSWMSLFWFGFGLMSLFAGRIRRIDRMLTSAAAMLGALLLTLATLGGSLVLQAVTQLLAGAAWGLLLNTLFAMAIARAGPPRRAGAGGIMFAMLALAAMLRLAVAASTAGMPAAAVQAMVTWWPVMVWLAAWLALWLVQGPARPPQ